MTVSPSTLEILRGTAVATLATVLRQNGLRSIWMRGPRPIATGQPRIAGPAFTLRFVPAREISRHLNRLSDHDRRAPRSRRCRKARSSSSTRWASSMPAVFGDIVCARMQYRKVAGLITDGAIRDLAGMVKLNWPIWANGTSAPPSTAGNSIAPTRDYRGVRRSNHFPR